MTEQTPTQEEQLIDLSTMQEAPASLNFYGVTAKGWNCQFTLRDLDEMALMRRFSAFVRKLEDWNITPKQVGQPQQPAAQAAHAPQPPAPNGAPTPTPAPQTPAVSGVQTFVAERLEVTPKPENKCELKFYASGHQYPDLYTTNTVERLLALLAPTGGWTADHLAKAFVHDVHMIVEWTPSAKLNSRGNPYKDLQALRPA